MILGITLGAVSAIIGIWYYYVTKKQKKSGTGKHGTGGGGGSLHQGDKIK